MNKAVEKADLVFLHLTSTISSGAEEINSKLIVYIRDFKSSKKFEPVPPEVTKKKKPDTQSVSGFFYALSSQAKLV